MSRLLIYVCCCLLLGGWAAASPAEVAGSQPKVYARDHLLHGSLRDAKTGAPLPYVSIGFSGQPAGTMTDQQGTFTFSVRDEYLDRHLRFSVVGYQAREVPVRQLLEEQTAKGSLQIPLEAKPKVLTEVQVKARHKKFLTQQVGSQIGKLTP